MCLPDLKPKTPEVNTKIATTPPAASKAAEDIYIGTDTAVRNKKYLKGASINNLKIGDDNTTTSSGVRI